MTKRELKLWEEYKKEVDKRNIRESKRVDRLNEKTWTEWADEQPRADSLGYLPGEFPPLLYPARHKKATYEDFLDWRVKNKL